MGDFSSCVCLSDFETSRGEPGSRVLVQADNSFSARRRPVLWADIQDVVHCLLWGTTFTDRGVSEAPLQHGRAEPAYTRAKAVEGCPLLSRQVEARCHGLSVYAVCVCNKVRLPGTGQSAHVIGGSRFTRPASNSRRTLLN